MLDSGANRHVVNDADCFVEGSVKPVNFRCTVGNGTTSITSMGDVLLKDKATERTVMLTQVILMENNSKNILSLVVCNDAGCTSATADGVCTVSLKGAVILRGVLNTHARLFLMDATVLVGETYQSVQSAPPLLPNMRLCASPRCHLQHRHTDDDPSPRAVPAATMKCTKEGLSIIPLPSRLRVKDA